MYSCIGEMRVGVRVDNSGCNLIGNEYEFHPLASP